MSDPILPYKRPDHRRIDAEDAIARLPPAVGCLILVLAWGGFVLVFVVSFRIAFHLLERPAITQLYGAQAYAGGLRVVGRQGQLSDGRRLPGSWNVLLGLGAFIASLPPALIHAAVLAHLGLLPPERLMGRWKAKPERERRR